MATVTVLGAAGVSAASTIDCVRALDAVNVSKGGTTEAEPTGVSDTARTKSPHTGVVSMLNATGYDCVM
jgi:hypothetical protein